LQTFSNEYQPQSQLFSLYLDFAQIAAAIKEMNNESLFIAQKRAFAGEKPIRHRIKSFCNEIVYFPEHTLSAKRNLYYRTEPTQAEYSFLPLLRSACFLSIKSSNLFYLLRFNKPGMRLITRYCS